MAKRVSMALVLLVAVALASGCGPKVTRTVDPSAGEFYTEEEYQKLTKQQRVAYCSDLLEAYRDGQNCADTAGSGLAKERAAVGDLEGEMTRLQPQLKSLKSEVEALEREIAYFEGLPRTHTVKKGEFLYKISGYDEIYADPHKWKRIYRANRDKIDDPNLIYPDQEFTIPRDWPHSYTVREGDTLWRIASFWEHLGDSGMWERIFEANKAQITNPDLIQPGQVLVIPR